MCPRRYVSPARSEGVAATRTRILEAARNLIGGKGDLTGFSMESVAAKAGVARMTVYYQFESRAGLLEALADHLAERGGMDRMRLVFLEPDRDRALRILAETFVTFWAKDRETMRRLRALAVVSPSVARGPRDRDGWRREAIARLLGRHAVGRGSARSGGPEVVDVITALTSFETFDTLCTGGRKPDAVAALIGDLAVAVAHPSR